MAYFYAIYTKYLGDILLLILSVKVFFRLLCLCSVKMAYRILQVEGRVLSCQSKPNDNKRLQKNM